MRFSLLFVVLLLMGCDVSATKVLGETKSAFRFGEVMLSIPKEYIVEDMTYMPHSTSLDSGNEVLLKLPLSDLGMNVTKENGLIHNVTLLISERSEHYKNNSLSPDAVDAWKGNNLYDERIIEFDNVVKLYRVSSDAGHPKLWHYFKTTPEIEKPVGDNWIADCMIGPLEEEKKDLSNAICEGLVLYKALQIEISFSGLHINSLSNIESSIMNKLKSWSNGADQTKNQ